MSVIGNIIKTAITVKDTLTPALNPYETQRSVLQDLLQQAGNTAFGKRFNFDDILKSEDVARSFSRQVPIYDYHKMEAEWWHRTVKGEPDISWPGSPDYFALSSGTTGGSSKRIPVTAEMLQAIKDTGVKQVTSLANYNLPAEFFEKEILMLGSSTDLTQKNEHLEGEISGISAANIPFWFKGYYKPGDEIASIDDWDERVKKIVMKAPDWDIGAISGIPSWIELMLKAVIEHYHLKNIHDLWPNLMVYTSGGVAFEPYQKSFNKLLAKPITVIDTYLASEGFLAFQSHPDSSSMALVLDNGIYFEFIPFTPDAIDDDGMVRGDVPTLTLEQIEEETDYILLISTVGGAWRYLIGDTIKFTDKGKAEIKITGRTKHFLNVVGSQLSVAKMNDAMRHLEKGFNITVPEFTVAAIREHGEYIHKWYLGVDAPSKVSKEVIQIELDSFLRSVNKNYNVARSKALKDVKVELISPTCFYDWNEQQKKKGGQVKFKRVMTGEEFTDWESFVKRA